MAACAAGEDCNGRGNCEGKEGDCEGKEGGPPPPPPSPPPPPPLPCSGAGRWSWVTAGLRNFFFLKRSGP